jgi:hypothetical protein
MKPLLCLCRVNAIVFSVLIAGGPAWTQQPPPGAPAPVPSPIPGSSFLRRPPFATVPVPAPIPVPTPVPSNIPSKDDFNLATQRAREFGQFLANLRVEQLICRAMAALFDATQPLNGCASWVINNKKTVAFQVTTRNSVSKIYEIELLGKSVELALKTSHWVERHRFYVAFGFDGRLEPHLTTFNFEPMLRTTSDIFPVQDALFEYIGRERDSLLRAFEDRLKYAIVRALETAMEGRQAEAR